MQLKKVISVTDSQIIQGIKVEVPEKKIQAHSQNTLSMVLRSRQRIPNILQSTLRNKASENRSSKAQGQENNLKQSKIGIAIKSKIPNMLKSSKSKKLCEVCDGEIVKPKNKTLQVFMCECEHKQSFCESCLHHYVIYKVKTFEEVHCPHEGCPAMLDINSKFFQQLPVDVQKAYKKVSQFYMASKNPGLKMCPKENCEGILHTTTENVMVCDGCEYTCCGKCLLLVHQGECDSQQIKFFQSNLHYRQCKKCKFIIQKNQGCNHMTCRCGNQFCYVCGADWSPAHYGNHDQNGQLVPAGQAAAVAVNQNNDACCDCDCVDDFCGQACGCVLKFPIKVLFGIGFLILMLLIFISRDLLLIMGMSIVCIFAGIFGFSFEILSQAEGWLCFLGILFFPITMILGIGKAFGEIFCDVVPDLCTEYWDIFGNGCRGICQI